MSNYFFNCNVILFIKKFMESLLVNVEGIVDSAEL